MQRTLSLIALLAVAACGGSTLPPNATAPDGGSSCLQPTVMPLLSPPGGVTSGLVDVDLGGGDSVVLTSVHIRPSAGGASLAFVEGARLSVPAEAGGTGALLASGGSLSDDGLELFLPPGALDLRALASGQRLAIRLELAGSLPQGPLSVTLEVCVHQHYGIL